MRTCGFYSLEFYHTTVMRWHGEGSTFALRAHTGSMHRASAACGPAVMSTEAKTEVASCHDTVSNQGCRCRSMLMMMLACHPCLPVQRRHQWRVTRRRMECVCRASSCRHAPRRLAPSLAAAATLAHALPAAANAAATRGSARSRAAAAAFPSSCALSSGVLPPFNR